MKLLGIRTADNDFTHAVFESIKKIKDSHENWAEMLNPENPALRDVLAFMIAQYQAMHRPDLYLLYPRWPFNAEEIWKDRQHTYEYMKSRLQFMVVSQADEFPDNWDNSEAVGIDLTSGYMWIM